MTLIILFAVVALIIVVVSITLVVLEHNREDELAKLGVSKTYPNSNLPTARIDAYFDLKERLQSQYAKDTDPDLKWMSSLPAQAKDLLKYRLMQRAVGDMAILQKIDSDARGFHRLFSKGVITRTFWDSVLEAEKTFSAEIDDVKAEAACLEPNEDPQSIVSQAMQFVIQYGQSAAAAANADLCISDAINDMIRHLPPPPDAQQQQAASVRQLPMGPPGSMPPPGHPARPPQQQGAPLVSEGGSEADGYLWKQDPDEIEVSVVVPPSATKREVKVTFGANRLRVEHSGKVLCDGQLAMNCCPDGSTWTISKGRVVVSLEKAEQKPWPDVFAKKA